MKKLCFLALLIAILFIEQGYSQMDNGNYKFENSAISLQFTITGSGWEISDVIIIKKSNNLKISGTGYWHKLNMKGLPADYKGPEGWYEFQTSDCNYSFDEPINNKLILSRFNCKDNSKSAKYVLYRKTQR